MKPKKHKMSSDEMEAEDITREAMRPVRKSENGRYEGATMEHLGAAGIDEDDGILKKKKK